MANEAAFLRDYLTTMTGLKLAVKAGATGDNRITLAIDPAIGNAEGYRLEVDRSGMKLTGGSAAGVFYGVQTIRKSVPHVTAEPVVFPAVEISDYPRFAYRGAHLDPCRALPRSPKTNGAQRRKISTACCAACLRCSTNTVPTTTVSHRISSLIPAYPTNSILL